MLIFMFPMWCNLQVGGAPLSQIPPAFREVCSKVDHSELDDYFPFGRRTRPGGGRFSPSRKRVNNAHLHVSDVVQLAGWRGAVITDSTRISRGLLESRPFRIRRLLPVRAPHTSWWRPVFTVAEKS